MRFWDSSALVPLFSKELPSAACHALLRSDPRIVVWMFTRTEIIGALCRHLREGLLDAGGLRAAESRLEQTARRWQEMNDVATIRAKSERLLRIHPLRAADALQLGAALVSIDSQPQGRMFVTLDDALADAAAREGFDVIRPGT